MKRITHYILLATLFLFSSCSENVTPVAPVVPVLPVTERKMYFHCAIHNLSYRFVQYIDDQYKALKMPCPVCSADSASQFMKSHNFNNIQLLCPIDSTWTTVMYTSSNTTLYDLVFKNKRTPFNPIIPTTNNLGTYTTDNLTTMSLNSGITTICLNYPQFSNCWCQACINKALSTTIKYRQDSIIAFHNSINGIIGMTFTAYPINTGVPPDRRVRAVAILDSIETILPNIESGYNKNYNTINGFVGWFSRARQDYIYANRNGLTQGTYLSYDTKYKVCSDSYISDTIVINIGGGPDYMYGGLGAEVDLYKAKSTYTIQSVKALKTTGFKNLSQSGNKTKSFRSKTDSQYQLSTDFVPGNIDLFPSQYLSRKYNNYNTSVFNIFHPQKGNQLYPDGTMFTWNFIDMAKSVGGWNSQFPNNIVSAYTAEVANDIGTMEIRKVVEWCKARGKHMVLMGTSWGGAMILNYLLYYPSTDFDQIIIADQNPNIPGSIIESYMNDYIYGGTALQYGTDPTYKQINVNMCLISADSYRRLDWFKNQNLSNTTFYQSALDTSVGVISAEDVSSLKNMGAKVFEFPSPIDHGVFHDYRAWYRYVMPTQM